MNLLYLVLLAIVVFLATLICFERKSVWSTIIAALGIGGIVNANFFNASDYPIDVFGWDFGIDSIIFTLFIFTVILKFLYQGKKEAYIFTFSAVAAVMFAAVYEVVAKAFTVGHSEEIWRHFGGFIISIVATIAACSAIIEIMDLLRKKSKIHDFWSVLIGLIVATLVNSTIYYGLYSVVTNTELVIELVYTSYFGKLIAIAFAMMSFGFMKLIERRIKRIKQKKAEDKTKSIEES